MKPSSTLVPQTMYPGCTTISAASCESKVRFAGQPIELELRLSVMDSPNSAGCAMDAIRYCAAALDRGFLVRSEAPSAFFMKRLPVQLTLESSQGAWPSYFLTPRKRAVSNGKAAL